MKNFFSDKAFFRNLFLLIIPIIFQELLNSSVNLVDNFMIGQLGEVAITSVGLANQIFFIFNLILFGVNSGASVFVGQYFGKGDFSGIHKVMGLGIILSLLNALIFVTAIVFAPEFLMSLYSKDPAVIAEGVNYLKVISPAYFVIAFIMAINAALKAIRKTHFPMITTFIALITNIILNYLFIFKLGYGVKGAAMATLCARCVELSAQLLITFGTKAPILTNIKNYFNFNKSFVASYFDVCTPIILNEIFWSIGISVCNMAYKFSGTDAQSAIQITGTIQNLFVVMGVAIGGGCGILLSNTLGRGDIEKAKEYSKKCMILTVIISSIMGIILVILSPYIINMFNVKDLVKEYTHKLLMVVSFGLIFKTYNYTTIVGILRSGGDTKYTAILDFSSVWLIGIPMAFLGAYFLNLPIYITYAMVYLEEIIKGFLTSTRVKKYKWAKSLV
ncbi:MATE family efflux transporter [uncultured Tyzzerella sp.]|uniref:MATE family efflux transporter n=1 Tax=uncultured Tyzzerella sp. TaxID=2321398 RepID=UPI0029424254|nr:MATE family efflux transporter [uncultured Tyzzerella sp.]